jgi:hypothetical protein
MTDEEPDLHVGRDTQRKSQPVAIADRYDRANNCRQEERDFNSPVAG